MTAVTTRILVLRHGESEWNATGRWQGRANPALNERGRTQAFAAGRLLGTFDAIWSSDLVRAAETAAIIAGALGVGPVIVDTRLQETDVGPWEGLTRAEVEAGWPGFLSAHRRPEGFEPYGAAAQRAADALAEIARHHPGDEVLAISHGGVISALVRHAGHAETWRIRNLSGAWLTVSTSVDAHRPPTVAFAGRADLDVDSFELDAL